jgi:hypothetical protein
MKVEIERANNGFIVRKFFRDYDDKTNQRNDFWTLDETDVWEINEYGDSWTYDHEDSDAYTARVSHLVWSILDALGVDYGNKYTRRLRIEWEWGDHHDFKKEELLALKKHHEEELKWINELLVDIEKGE